MGDQFLADLLVTAGSTLALAAVVFFLEPQFLRTTEVKIQELKRGVTAELAEAKWELINSFDQSVASALLSIDEAYEQRLAERKSAQEDVLEDLREAPGRSKVVEALQNATDINAIHGYQVVVKSAFGGGARIAVEYSPRTSTMSRSCLDDLQSRGSPTLTGQTERTLPTCLRGSTRRHFAPEGSLPGQKLFQTSCSRI